MNKKKVMNKNENSITLGQGSCRAWNSM